MGTETYYYYYYQTKSGSFKADKIRTDKCEVFYTKDTPHIDTIIQIPDEEQTKNWLTLSWLLSLQTSSNERYKIYVPEGSITDDFSIDMEWEGNIDLWFGEAKFYVQYKSAITPVMEKLSTSLSDGYLNRNLLAIIDERPHKKIQILICHKK